MQTSVDQQNTSQSVQINLIMNVLPWLLLLLKGVCSLRPIYIRTGEMVVLRCPLKKDANATLLWTTPSRQGKTLTISVSAGSADLGQMDMMPRGRSLVILTVSMKHHGNYSCSIRNDSSSFWFSLIVYGPDSREYEERNLYSAKCYTEDSCTLYCPKVHIPNHDTPDITSRGITWHKEGERLATSNKFSNVTEKDGGVYTCIRSFLYNNHIYNMTFKVILEIQQSTKPEILSPKHKDVFLVNLGSTVVIHCKTVLNSDLNQVFWLSDSSFVDTNESLPVFYNHSRDQINMTATLVLRDVSEEDLLKNYTCKLESDQHTSFATISLAEKGIFHDNVSVNCCLVAVYLALQKLHFFCLDGKSYDAFLMCYKSSFDGGLNEDDIKYLINTLEDQFGYSLCLYDRDVSPGQAVADAVLECVEQSRAVILVPSLPDPEPGNNVLSAIHAFLVEQKTHLIFINTGEAEASTSGSFQEALQLLSKEGDSVTWKGRSSSSHFWKQLRYHLSAPQQVPKMQLLPQEC
uniref:Uncharacterized LOC107082512 n=1 Tax=Cyprinodon variegatus TaxID=28743 RepID=A0A3Q2CR04_CYPVA